MPIYCVRTAIVRVNRSAYLTTLETVASGNREFMQVALKKALSALEAGCEGCVVVHVE